MIPLLWIRFPNEFGEGRRMRGLKEWVHCHDECRELFGEEYMDREVYDVPLLFSLYRMVLEDGQIRRLCSRWRGLHHPIDRPIYGNSIIRTSAKKDRH
jgi:hypothetical protein